MCRVAASPSRSIRQVARAKPSTSTNALPPTTPSRWPYGSTRERSSWPSRRLSNHGRKRGGAGSSPVAIGASGRSSSSRPRSSAKTRSPGRRRVDDRGEARQARPEPHVGHARGPERGEVAQDQRVRLGLLRQRAAGQLRHRRHHGLPAGLLERRAARRQLGERHGEAHRVGERRRVGAGPALRQRAAERGGRARRLGEDGAAGRHDLRHVDAAELLGELAAREALLEHRLVHRAPGEEVVGGRQVQRGAHQRRAQHLVGLEQRDQLRGLEALQPRPQAVERRGRLLALHAGEVLDRLARAQRRAAQQQLALEQGAVELAGAEDRGSGTDRGARRS